MQFARNLTIFALLAACFITIQARPQAYLDYDPRYDQLVIKRASNPVDQALVMARLHELMGPEAFTEIDSHGRLSNLQRLG